MEGELQMSRKTTKSILSRDEISLLCNSEILKDVELYGNLYDMLTQLPELRALTLNDFIERGLDERGKIILTHTKGKIIDGVMQEWYIESKSAEDPDKKVKCGLCNTPNKYLFYIRNRLNNAQLNVGSSCMKKFSEIEGYANHKYQLSKIQRNHQQTARWIKFHDKFPEAESIIDSANFYFDNIPILLPYKIYFSLEKTVHQLHIVYNKYIKYGKTPNDTSKNSFDLFDETINVYIKLKKESDEFINENLNNNFMCKRSEIDWILKQKKHSLLEQISRNNGKYTLETIGKISSIDFIKTNFKSIQKALNSKDIILIMPQNTQDNFQFLLGYGNNILYNINIKKFMKSIGAYCIFHSNFKYDKQDLINVSEISITNKNIEIILSCLQVAVKRLNYVFLIDERTHTIYL